MSFESKRIKEAWFPSRMAPINWNKIFSKSDWLTENLGLSEEMADLALEASLRALSFSPAKNICYFLIFIIKQIPKNKGCSFLWD